MWHPIDARALELEIAKKRDLHHGIIGYGLSEKYDMYNEQFTEATNRKIEVYKKCLFARSIRKPSGYTEIKRTR